MGGGGGDFGGDEGDGGRMEEGAPGGGMGGAANPLPSGVIAPHLVMASMGEGKGKGLCVM